MIVCFQHRSSAAASFDPCLHDHQIRHFTVSYYQYLISFIIPCPPCYRCFQYSSLFFIVCHIVVIFHYSLSAAFIVVFHYSSSVIVYRCFLTAVRCSSGNSRRIFRLFRDALYFAMPYKLPVLILWFCSNVPE